MAVTTVSPRYRERPLAVLSGALLAFLLSVGLASCSGGGPSAQPGASEAVGPTEAAAAPPGPGNRSALGPVVADSFGNADFYTTLPGDTPASVAGSFRISAAKLAAFNGLQPGNSLTPGTVLRLIPAPGPLVGAKGTATVDAKGIPTTYVVEPDDTLGGILYRFGLTGDQLAEANKVPYVYEKGNVYFLLAGRHLQLQKNPVDSRSGTGAVVANSYRQPVFYTTVDGDSSDGLGYKFRVTADQLRQYNPGLTTDRPIPAGTRMKLTAAELAIDGAQGSFTAGIDGIPLTYTTVPGDTERQVAFRFNIPDLRAANRPLTPGAGSWYDLIDPPTGGFTPGQTISLALDHPINK